VDDNGYLMNRQLHLNYYAVKGLLARIYLYKGDLPKALESAETVINANKFAWIQKINLELEQQADLVFSTEHLFALNVTRLNTIYQNGFTATGVSIFYISKASRTEYYDSAAEDFRYLYWYRESDDGNLFLKKYAQRTEAAWPVAYRNKIPMIKLPEVYFIAAEALKSSNITRAAELINTVRTHRGLTATPINADNFDAVLMQEFRKEFIGEGQLFFYYKRKNLARIPKAANYDIISLKGYKLPIPVSEFSNAPGRVDNR
ncbi:MAG: RagB/SusD family nutrient uptake outer membrane protein, partial [Pedobacter sp.]